MILLLGASGYIGQAFANALRERNPSFTPLSRDQLDYTNFGVLLKFLRETIADRRKRPRAAHGIRSSRTAQGASLEGG